MYIEGYSSRRQPLPDDEPEMRECVEARSVVCPDSPVNDDAKHERGWVGGTKNLGGTH